MWKGLELDFWVVGFYFSALGKTPKKKKQGCEDSFILIMRRIQPAAKTKMFVSVNEYNSRDAFYEWDEWSDTEMQNWAKQAVEIWS